MDASPTGTGNLELSLFNWEDFCDKILKVVAESTDGLLRGIDLTDHHCVVCSRFLSLALFTIIFIYLGNAAIMGIERHLHLHHLLAPLLVYLLFLVILAAAFGQIIPPLVSSVRSATHLEFAGSDIHSWSRH